MHINFNDCWYSHCVQTRVGRARNNRVAKAWLNLWRSRSLHGQIFEMDELELCSNNQSYPALTDGVILATQLAGSITCVLSILGASLIIFTYVAFKDLRTIARQLLVSLSVADIIIVLSHFIGLFANYRRFIIVDDDGVRGVSNSSSRDAVCIIQGAFSAFGTIASLLLSMLIAFYLLVLTQSKSTKPARRLLPFIYIVSWGVPLIIVAVVAGLQSFGYEAISNPGTMHVTSPNSESNSVGPTHPPTIIIL